MENSETKDSTQGEYEVTLEEYRGLRNEIMHRIRMQFQIIVAAVILVGAALPFIPAILESQRFVMFLAAAPVYLALGWLYFEQDTWITQAATYLNSEVRSRIAKALVNSRPVEQSEKDVPRLLQRILRWEDFRNEMLFGRCSGIVFSVIMLFFRLTLAAGAGLAALFAFVYFTSLNPSTHQQWHLIDATLFGFDVLLAIIVILTAVRTLWQYKGIKVQGKA